jgi:hypothetical protein
MTRILRGVALVVVLAAAAIVFAAGTRQAAPNATRVVISARQSWCTPDGRWFSTGHTGWLPTAACLYPPAVPALAR